jgi:hypothetical protein
MARNTAARTKRGPVSRTERTRYRARIASDTDWGRPTEATARRICALLDVDPMTLRTSRDREDKIAAQAFAVAIDWVIRLGDRSEAKEGEPEPGARLTFNGLFDALAGYWSAQYRDAQKRGATVSYDMSEATLTGDDDCAWRELLAAGVNVEAIWALLIRQTRPPKKPPRKPPLPPHPGLAKLYLLRRARGRRYSESRKVQLYEGQLLDDVRYAILRDPQYERPVGLRLLLANEKASELPTRQSICEERPYDVVKLGQRSKDVLAVLEGARLRFYVEQFREDFEALDEFRRHQPRPHRVMVVQRRGYERAEQTVRSLRPIYEQTAGLANLPRDGQGRAYVMIRSRFFRALNRRFNAADFWPEHVAADLREHWFGLEPVTPRVGRLQLDAEGRVVSDGDGRVVRVALGGQAVDIDANDRFVNDQMSSVFVERDVSSSQTQILAVFLGLPDLEVLAMNPDKKFKLWLAERLWAVHEKTPGGLLANGYSGPDDERLVAFIKELWMRRNYGGKFGQAVRSLARDPVTFGPGWNSNVFATGGVTRAEGYWTQFLRTLPPWSAEVTRFLDACKYIGRSADPLRGVVFTDPLDGAEVQWNPVRRATKKLSAGEHYIEARLSGVLRKHKRFIRCPWTVDTRANGDLANRVAPCVIHTLDAYFNALVLTYLGWECLDNFVAIHDSWIVPLFHLYVDQPGGCSGSELLGRALDDASRDWLCATTTLSSGLGGVYEWFVGALTGSPYEDLATGARDRWRQRLAEGRWPKFTAV